MKQLIILIILIIPFTLFSQNNIGDTLNIQVFTFDMPSPAIEPGNSYNDYNGKVKFPEDNSQWGKVLMIKKLKCDSATARDKNPCGEWDVLTQTILYVPKGDTVEKFQLISFVTPYGNGLKLGDDDRWTWVFDVTDYLPLFEGEMEISAGNNQELLDLKFVFIKGTPARTPMSVENIYPTAKYKYEYLATDSLLKAKKIVLNEDATSFMLRARISGHGHFGPHNCCEWDNKYHTYNIGDWNQFKWNVWKDCGFNPIYPQGGTWPFNRAGWCPGTAVDEHDFNLSKHAFPGDTVLIDYNIEMYKDNGEKDGDYFMSHQLFSYGPANFHNDAEIMNILAPSSKDQYSRINPICGNPIIEIKNTGSNTLKSLIISYGLENGETAEYMWNGSLEFLESEEVLLPIPNWKGLKNEKTFKVEVSKPNNMADEYSKNNIAYSEVSLPLVLPSEFIIYIQSTDQDRAKENGYTISRYNGEILYQEAQLADSTLTKDKISLKDGCYEFRLTDRFEDGMNRHWWLRGEDPSKVGINGEIKIISLDGKVLHLFPYDFGQELLMNFRVGDLP